MERPRALPYPQGPLDKGTRWSLLKAPAKQSAEQLALLAEVQQANRSRYGAFLLKEEPRLLYQLERPALAPAHLDAWLAWASRSKLDPFVKLVRTIHLHRHGILAAIRLGLTNGRLGGLNSRIRLISPQLRIPLRRIPHRPRLPLLLGHHDPASAKSRI